MEASVIGVRDRLEAAVLRAMDRAAEAPMQWGVDDCALWCADPLLDVLGYDAAGDYRGRYASRDEARAVLGKAGLPAAIRAAALRHGWESIEPASAESGDIGVGMVKHCGEMVPATVICRAPGWFVGRNEMGWTALPAGGVSLAWRVVPRTTE